MSLDRRVLWDGSGYVHVMSFDRHLQHPLAPPVHLSYQYTGSAIAIPDFLDLVSAMNELCTGHEEISGDYLSRTARFAR